MFYFFLIGRKGCGVCAFALDFHFVCGVSDCLGFTFVLVIQKFVILLTLLVFTSSLVILRIFFLQIPSHHTTRKLI